jgi:Tetrapyrrole (Corrin/Porphyrin) Methylases
VFKFCLRQKHRPEAPACLTRVRSIRRSRLILRNLRIPRRLQQPVIRLIHHTRSGITAIAHLTLETIGYIQYADVVFYHANSGITATHIRELNPNAVDLYEYYGEGKIRNITYVQMAELMLREVRRGLSVVGLFHGHPGYFVKAGRRALAIAQMEGHETVLLPGISATDCLFSDLRIDPGVIGVQILKAAHVLREDACVATSNHVVLVQVGSVGDNTFSFTGFKHTKLDRFFEKLISIYGEEQDSIYYVASIFPGLDPVILERKLGEYRHQKVQDTVNAATLYLPPAGVRVKSLMALQAFENKDPYGKFELDAIKALDTHRTPTGFRNRGASKAMLGVMVELGTSPEAVHSFRRSPDEFFERHRDLSSKERQALFSRETGKMRSVTTTEVLHSDENSVAISADLPQHNGDSRQLQGDSAPAILR